MTVSIAITLTIFLGAAVLFVLEALPVDMIALLVLLLVTVTGVITPEQAFSSFTNSAVVMIVLILVLTQGVIRTGIADRAAHLIYRLAGRSEQAILNMVLLLETTVSAFINNVAATAMFIPGIMSLARSTRQSPSRWLIPLAYASMLGGTCTLIGTSTNIAVSGALTEYRMEPLRMFELTPVGIVIALAGGLYLLFLGSRFLPRHKIESLTEEYSIRQFLTEVLVNEGSPLAGKSIQNSGFMEKFGSMILGIIRNREKIIAPDKNLLLEVHDLLLVKISAENLSALRETPGIEIRPKTPLSDKDMISHEVGLAELTVAYNSHLVGRTLKETNFRQRYALTALAIYRHGETLIEKIGKIKLRFGDVLLVQGIRQRILQLKQDKDFMLLQEVRVERRNRTKMLHATGIMALTIIVAGVGPWPVTVVFLFGCLAMVLFKCLPADEAYSAINWRLVTLLGGMIALGRAMEVSGTAEYLARLLVDLLGSYGPMTLLSGFFFLTVLLTQPMSNNAAALLVLPIAIHAAQNLGVNPRTFAVTVTFAASCSFMTPFEPCCVLVYGPGRYRFMDFVRAGALLTGVVYIVVILLVPVFWKL